MSDIGVMSSRNDEVRPGFEQAEGKAPSDVVEFSIRKSFKLMS
jgi:hypothetical protein